MGGLITRFGDSDSSSFLDTITLTSQAEADISALLWTLRYIDEDDELQVFLNGLPRLHNVDALHHLAGLREGLELLVKPVRRKRFPTTGVLSEGIRRHRLTAYLGAIWCFPSTIDRHFGAIWEQWVGQGDERPLGSTFNGDMDRASK